MRRASLLTLTFLAFCMFVPRIDTGLAGVGDSLPSDMPVVYVDPPSITAPVGRAFTVSVKVFNLSDNYYQTSVEWQPGFPLGPPGTRFNYSLGNLYGFDLRLNWDPAILDYVNHSVKVPVEEFPEGILHEPIIDLVDEVNNKGEYWLAKASQHPAEPFNSPDGNATVFTMTFRAKKIGVTVLNLSRLDLATSWSPWDPHKPEIPHWAIGGSFEAISGPSAVYFNISPNPTAPGQTLTLKGVLVDETTNPLANELVELYARRLSAHSWSFVTSMTTNAWGVFRWQTSIPRNALPDTYLLVVYYPGSETYESCYNFNVLIIQ